MPKNIELSSFLHSNLQLPPQMQCICRSVIVRRLDIVWGWVMDTRVGVSGGDWGWPGMVGDGWGWLGMVRGGQGWLEMVGVDWGWSGMVGGDWGWSGMVGDGRDGWCA